MEISRSFSLVKVCGTFALDVCRNRDVRGMYEGLSGREEAE